MSEINVFYCNINGFLSKKQHIHSLLMEKKPPILVICETKLSPDQPVSDLCLPKNYSVYRKDRLAGAGGLCFLVRSDICISLCVQNAEVKCEVFAIDLLLRNRTIVV